MDSKGAFAKALQKTLIRTKAKVLQNLGKADKTTDERFEDHIANFTRQQAVAVRLHKEVKHYVSCIKAMTVASKNLFTVIQETCEPEWVDLHNIDSAMRSLDMLYSNYEAELFERVCTDLHTYIELFNPMKEKINKRRRKLLDYDNAKHGYESALSAKKTDDIKVAKTLESLKEAERLFHDLNSELHRELPKFYKYRVDLISSNLSRFYSTESTFHTETGKITDDMYSLMEQVPKSDDSSFGNAADNAVYSIAITDQSGLDLSTMDHSMHSPSTNAKSSHLASVPQIDGEDVEYSPITYHSNNDRVVSGSTDVSSEGAAVGVSSQAVLNTNSSSQATSNADTLHSDIVKDDNLAAATTSPDVTKKLSDSLGKRDDDGTDETVHLAESLLPSEYDMPPPSNERDSGPDENYHYSAPPANSDDDIEEGSVYQNIDSTAVPAPTPQRGISELVGEQVLATHTYTAVDEDELSFEAGEIINVEAFDDPDDQDEGWLMGVSTKTGRGGVFPENFTRKIITKKTADF